MAASPIADPHEDGHPAHWSDPLRQHLLDVARRSLHHGVQHGRPLRVDPGEHPEALRAPFAVFVTLFRHDALRGCIGSLEPEGAVVEETARNAFGAGFHDPRFHAVTVDELNDGLHVELSVLDVPEPVAFEDEADLLSKLRPHTDGLILTHAGRKGTFLPAVWQHVPEPAAFLSHLKAKAGLPDAPLPADAAVHRYTVTKIT